MIKPAAKAVNIGMNSCKGMNIINTHEYENKKRELGQKMSPVTVVTSESKVTSVTRYGKLMPQTKCLDLQCGRRP